MDSPLAVELEVAALRQLQEEYQRAYCRARFPRIQSVRRGASTGTQAHVEGREAGRSIVLHRGVTAPGGGDCRGRLLGPRRD